MLVSIIVAMAKNRVIGRKGELPWHLPSDLQRFKQLTMGHTLVMGRRTFESIGRVLPGRRTIVLSRDPDYSAADCAVATNIKTALQLASPAEELFICGGADIYRQTLPLVEKIYLTELDVEIEGDRHFPTVSSREFEIIQTLQIEDKLNYRFSILQRCA
ncbi:MAG: diacylglycerol kinase [Deltaproteobacteria bacterium]|nr:MAG: diacylglycerol kinase [Deltaproteobacteria bacterium]